MTGRNQKSAKHFKKRVRTVQGTTCFYVATDACRIGAILMNSFPLNAHGDQQHSLKSNGSGAEMPPMTTGGSISVNDGSNSESPSGKIESE